MLTSPLIKIDYAINDIKTRATQYALVPLKQLWWTLITGITDLSNTLFATTVGSMKSWQYGKEALTTWYITLPIYKHKLGHPESLKESPSTFFSSSGNSGVNLENLVMTQLPGWQPGQVIKIHKFLWKSTANLWKLSIKIFSMSDSEIFV